MANIAKTIVLVDAYNKNQQRKEKNTLADIGSKIDKYLSSTEEGKIKRKKEEIQIKKKNELFEKVGKLLSDSFVDPTAVGENMKVKKYFPVALSYFDRKMLKTIQTRLDMLVVTLTEQFGTKGLVNFFKRVTLNIPFFRYGSEVVRMFGKQLFNFFKLRKQMRTRWSRYIPKASTPQELTNNILELIYATNEERNLMLKKMYIILTKFNDNKEVYLKNEGITSIKYEEDKSNEKAPSLLKSIRSLGFKKGFGQYIYDKARVLTMMMYGLSDVQDKLQYGKETFNIEKKNKIIYTPSAKHDVDVEKETMKKLQDNKDKIKNTIENFSKSLSSKMIKSKHYEKFITTLSAGKTSLKKWMKLSITDKVRSVINMAGTTLGGVLSIPGYVLTKGIDATAWFIKTAIKNTIKINWFIIKGIGKSIIALPKIVGKTILGVAFGITKIFGFGLKTTKKGVGLLFKGIKSSFKIMLTTLKQFPKITWMVLKNNVLNPINAAMRAVVSIPIDLMTDLLKGIRTAGEKTRKFIKEKLPIVMATTVSTIKWIRKEWGETKKFIKELNKKKNIIIKKTKIKMYKLFKKDIPNMMNNIKNLKEKIVEYTKEGIPGLIKKTKEFFQKNKEKGSIWERIKKSYEEFDGSFTQYLKSKVKKLHDVAKNTYKKSKKISWKDTEKIENKIKKALNLFDLTRKKNLYEMSKQLSKRGGVLGILGTIGMVGTGGIGVLTTLMRYTGIEFIGRKLVRGVSIAFNRVGRYMARKTIKGLKVLSKKFDSISKIMKPLFWIGIAGIFGVAFGTYIVKPILRKLGVLKFINSLIQKIAEKFGVKTEMDKNIKRAYEIRKTKEYEKYKKTSYAITKYSKNESTIKDPTLKKAIDEARSYGKTYLDQRIKYYKDKGESYEVAQSLALRDTMAKRTEIMKKYGYVYDEKSGKFIKESDKLNTKEAILASTKVETAKISPLKEQNAKINKHLEEIKQHQEKAVTHMQNIENNTTTIGNQGEDTSQTIKMIGDRQLYEAVGV